MDHLFLCKDCKFPEQSQNPLHTSHQSNMGTHLHNLLKYRTIDFKLLDPVPLAEPLSLQVWVWECQWQQMMSIIFFGWVVCNSNNMVFLTYETEFVLFLAMLWDRICSIFSDAGKFCIAHGLRQLTHNVKSDFRTLNFLISEVTSLLHHHETHQMTFRKGCCAT